MSIDLNSELSKKILHHRIELGIKSLHKIGKALGIDPLLVADTLACYRKANNMSATPTERALSKKVASPVHSETFVIHQSTPEEIKALKLKSKLTPFPFDRMEVGNHFALISYAEFNRCNKAVQQLRKNGYDRMFKVSQKDMKCWRIR